MCILENEIMQYKLNMEEKGVTGHIQQLPRHFKSHKSFIKYSNIDSNLSDSNVGAQKGRNILFCAKLSDKK